jgi:hypothetical protein
LIDEHILRLASNKDELKKQCFTILLFQNS